jgi:pimeloyl-[acyl-carrier protein] synthase
MNEGLDFRNPDFVNNPYPYYEKLRKLNGPIWIPQPKEMPSSSKGIWFFSRYIDAVSILKETSSISNDASKVRKEGETSPFFMHMLNRDGIEHSRLRNLVSKFFSTKYVHSIEDHMSKIIDDLLDIIETKTSVNLISDFAEKVPFGVIAEIMGIPPTDMPKVRAWIIDIGNGFDTMLFNEEIFKKQHQALLEFLDYLRMLVKNEENFDDTCMIKSLIQDHKEGNISEDEMIGMIGFVLGAGHETTIGLIGNGLWLLLSHRDQWQILVENPSMIPQAIEEVLRFESPLQRSNFRITEEDVNINGFEVKAGEQISVIVSSANRDETIFENADRFDIRRDPNPHIAFGIGVHNCLGKHLARVEVKIAFEKIIARFPHIKLHSDIPKWRKNTFFRALDELWVTL